jgi:ABC-type branched-subunit amino acid transport system ATPase component
MRLSEICMALALALRSRALLLDEPAADVTHAQTNRIERELKHWPPGESSPSSAETGWARRH